MTRIRRQYHPLSLALLVVILILTGCKSKQSSPFDASGRPLDLLAVVPDNYMNQSFKDSVKQAFAGPVKVLPQNEPICDVIFASSSKFTNVFKLMGNILYLDIDSTRYTRSSIHISRDEWANKQLIVTLRAPSYMDMCQLLSTKKDFLSNLYYNEELKRRVSNLTKTYSSPMQKMVQDSVNGALINPIVEINYLKGHNGFVWGSDLGSKARTDMVVYDFPYVDNDTFTVDYLIQKRDSVMKDYIHGEYPNSYMTTEKRVVPLFRAFKVNGKYCAEIRGLWSMVGDMMGGPFVMHAILDAKGERVIVAETFVYAPSTKKRNHVLKAEASLYTLRPEGTALHPDSVFSR